jgi:hypothetical protein
MIRITVNSGMKVPGEQEYSSKHASVTIDSEVSDISAIPEEAARLLSLSESLAKAHLDGEAAPITNVRPTCSKHQPQARAGSPNPPPATSHRPSGRGKYQPKQASAAQIRYLRMLLKDRPQSEEEDIAAENGVAVIDELSSKACSAVIDRLKTVAT